MRWKNSLPAHDDPMVGYALNRIERQYGHRCEVNRKDLEKFGGNPNVGTSEISLNSWGEDEVFQTSNVSLKMSSSSASDVGATIYIEHMYFDSKGKFRFRLMQATVNGQNKVDLPESAARWTRMYTSDQVVGDIYIYRDGTISGGVPTDLTTVHNHIPAGENQSQKSGTTIAHTNYFLMDNYWADVVKKAGASATIKLKVRNFGEEFRTAPRRGASDGHGLFHQYRSFLIVPPGSDIIMTASSTAASTDITGGFDGLFADIQ